MFFIESGDAAVLHMLKNKDNDPYRFVCHRIKVIKSRTKKQNYDYIINNLLIYIYIYGKNMKMFSNLKYVHVPQGFH